MTTFTDWLAQLDLSPAELDAVTRKALLQWYAMELTPREAIAVSTAVLGLGLDK